MGAGGISGIEGKLRGVATRELRKRASFKSDKILSIAPMDFRWRDRSVARLKANSKAVHSLDIAVRGKLTHIIL